MQSFKECLDDLKSKRVLIVHGLNSSGNGTTASNIKSVLNDFGITRIIAPDFNLLNYDETISKINELSKNVDIIIGHSLGGYYAMSLERPENFKILINPCIDPLTINTTLKSLKPLKSFNPLKFLNSLKVFNRQLTFGIFAKSDELFDFYDYFKEKFSSIFYGVPNYARIPGTHRPDKDALERGLIKAFNYYSKINDSIDFIPDETLNINENSIFFEYSNISNQNKNKIFAKVSTGNEKELMKAFNHCLKFDDSTDLMPDETLNNQNLNEKFVNVLTGNDRETSKYKDKVYEILYNSYKDIGGVAGLENSDNLISDSDFWKLEIKNNEILSVFVYTFKRGGRKVQYIGTNGTPEGKKSMYNIVKDDLRLKDRNAWIECSGAVEHIYLKMGARKMPIDEVRKRLQDKEVLDLTDKDIKSYRGKNNIDDGYHYKRLIGGKYHIKLMVY